MRVLGAAEQPEQICVRGVPAARSGRAATGLAHDELIERDAVLERVHFRGEDVDTVRSERGGEDRQETRAVWSDERQLRSAGLRLTQLGGEAALLRDEPQLQVPRGVRWREDAGVSLRKRLRELRNGAPGGGVVAVERRERAGEPLTSQLQRVLVLGSVEALGEERRVGLFVQQSQQARLPVGPVLGGNA